MKNYVKNENENEKAACNIGYVKLGIGWFAFVFSSHFFFFQWATLNCSEKPNLAYPNRWQILKKTMGRILIPILILLISACGSMENKETDEIDKARYMNDPGVPIHVLLDSVENHGSVHAFDLLETASLDYRVGEFLSTFMIMADKYNNAFASMSVYYQMVWMYNAPLIDNSENGIYVLDSLNNETRKMVIRYLIQADSLGNEEASEHLEEYKQNGIIE